MWYNEEHKNFSHHLIMKLVFRTILLVVIGCGLIFPSLTFAYAEANDFIYPLTNWNTSTCNNFGELRYGGTTYHIGDDCGNEVGQAVYAVANGRVKHIGEHTRFGHVILIEHTLTNGTKVVSLYGHLRGTDIMVSENQQVFKGQILGRTGTRAQNGSWSPHLHFGIRKGAYVDVNSGWVYWGMTTSSSVLAQWHNPTEFILNHSQTTYTRQTRIVTGPGISGRAHIRQLKVNGQSTNGDIYAFSSDFFGGADVATGDTNRNGKDEIVVGAGPGTRPEVKIFEKDTGRQVLAFEAYASSFRGGVRVACGDLNGDGFAEIITGPGPGGGPQVRVFYSNGDVYNGSIFPFSENLRTGVDVTTGDIDNDGKDEIIAGLGPGSQPQVAVISEYGKVKKKMTIFPAGFRGGVRVSTGDIDLDNKAEIIAAAGPGGGPHVRVFEADGSPRPLDFFPFHPDFRGGVDVASIDTDNDGKDEIIAMTSSLGQAWVKTYKYNDARLIVSNFMAYDAGFEGGGNVATVRNP
ncbi:MAG: VCBS repeat domain-containing M23 family metallopeptidase [bacterium]